MERENIIKGLLGTTVFNSFKKVFDACCGGISEKGDSNLVLNQKGEWVAASGDVQTLLSDLPEYLGAKEASEDGKPLGYWYYNTFMNIITKVTHYISSYIAGISTIDFTNNGGDDWTIALKLSPDTEQLPIGYAINSYDYIVDFWNGSGSTPLYDGTAITAPTTSLNTSGNGAGIYSMQVMYNATNGIDTKTFGIWNLIKVDGSGNVVDFVKLDGMTVNSVNGLIMSVTANITQSQSYPITWATSPTFTDIGTGISPTLTLNADADLLGYGVTLGAEFSEFTSPFGVLSSVTIN